jgi:hypothetical protein
MSSIFSCYPLTLSLLKVMPADVLQLHHKRNGRPIPPDPAILDSLCQAETQNPKLASRNSRKARSKAKASHEGPKTTQLSWYGPHWKSFLEYTKGECCALHAIKNPFPKFIDDLPGSVNEALMFSLVEWLEGGKQVEEGIVHSFIFTSRHFTQGSLLGVWPDHKHDMTKLVYASGSLLSHI